MGRMEHMYDNNGSEDGDDDSVSVESGTTDDDGFNGYGSTNSSPSSDGVSEEHEPHLARAENKAVSRSKMLVLGALFLAAVAVGAFWYIFLSRDEEEDFEKSAVEVSKKILDSADASVKYSLGPLRGLSNALTAHALATNATWPFVTLPNFDIQSSDQQALLDPSKEHRDGAELIMYAPLVGRDDRRSWEQYSVERQGWIAQDLHNRDLPINPGPVSDKVFDFVKRDDDDDYYVPLWQIGPVPTDASQINMDLYSHPSFRRMIDDAMEVKHILLSEVISEDVLSSSIQTAGWAASEDSEQDGRDERGENPQSYAVQPVFDSFEKDANVVGFIFAVLPWDSYFVDVLTETAGYRVDVETNCGSDFSYMINGPDATYLGRNMADEALDDDEDVEEDENDNANQSIADVSQFEYLAQHGEFAEFARWDGQEREGFYTIHCEYALTVTPTSEVYDEYVTNEPLIFTLVILVVFVFTTLVFVGYDWTVQRRQAKVMATATQSNKIIASLFPKNIQKRLMEEAEEKANQELGKKGSVFGFNTKSKLREYLNTDGTGMEEEVNKGSSIFDSKPLADLFPEATVMFADIVGFTAWSSTREPSQVFTLLETIYHSFDEIAQRRRIFKVETVGDCYVAVCGVPNRRVDHAAAMARFASECLNRLKHVLRDLEVSLGPSTTDLGMRVGLHSGPVTAGVLRGERARFQLFGDTMNTCARIESTGENGRIHISEQTANLLENAGKSHWLTQREELVTAKGKGELKTFWLVLKAGSRASSRSSNNSSNENSTSNEDIMLDDKGDIMMLSSKQERLVDWCSDMLSRFLKEIVARRQARMKNGLKATPIERMKVLEEECRISKEGTTVINEVEEIIYLPQFDAKAAKNQQDPESIELPEAVSDQLRRYVTTLASMYRQNPFHNFEHANHVASSVSKLLSRIIAPELEVDDENNAHATLHDETYGITSDPLTQFAVILSAVIHDVDHQGVPNTTLISESAAVAQAYKNKSVAEQNSVDLSWGLLMDDEFQDLRRTIYATESEFREFRQLIVNTVLATDIMDKELSAARKARWNQAFSEEKVEEAVEKTVNRKATIVIEHLIQASDVAHTMQHWHIFRKWNQRLFEEMYKAYKEGRSETDPSLNWYKGEIGFFDFYIIPLAKKLNDCGVFGVSSDEYLNYAQNNRREWELKGKEIVAEMVQKYNSGVDS